MPTDARSGLRFGAAFLRSRIARRIFLLFVVAALAPILVTALLVFTYVRDELTSEATQRLTERCKGYALDRLARLQQAALTLDGLASSASDDASPAETRLASLMLRRVTVHSDNAKDRALVGKIIAPLQFSPAERRWLDQQRPLLRTRLEADGHQAVLLARRVHVGNSARIWAAEVDPDFLWSPSAQSVAPSFVTVDLQGNALAATDAQLLRLAPSAVRDILAAQRGSGAAVAQVHDRIFSSWRVFMQPTFGIDGWTVIVFADRALVLQPIEAFQRLYPPVLGVTLLIVVLVSLIQIRRSHEPLEKIMAGTRRLAARDFSTPIDVRDRTEYSELALAFNEMSSRVEKQFVSLRTLADVDRLMLTSRNLEPVLEAILTHMRRTLGCEEVAIALADPDAEDIGRVYRLPRQGSAMTIERTQLGSVLLQSLIDARDGKCFECATDPDRRTAFHDLLGAAAGSTTVVVPVIPAISVAGLVAALFNDAVLVDGDVWAFLRDTAGRLAVALANDERQRALVRQAHFDSLTGLPNRELFRDRLSQDLLRMSREKRGLSLLFIDLDRFKHVNDSRGHSTGDRLLKITAERLLACVGEMDTVARLGGDEFTVILSDCASPEEAARVAGHILARLAEPYLLDDVQHFVSASIGIASAPADGQTPEQLLKCADMAMYRAKANERGSYAFFEQHMNQAAAQRLQLESQLRRSIDAGELLLYYQPQVHLLTGRIVAAEALVRWRHPTMGLVPPAHFIPLAEDSGLILQIGDWVIQESLRQLKAWQGTLDLSHVAVNVSTRQLRNVEFADRVLHELDRAGMPGQCLELEITESGLMHDVDGVVQRLLRLRSRCVRIAIDDFGTGYSSLTYLRDLPFDAIKIDRSFLKNLNSSEGAAIADAVITMAHALGKQVVAEGIELPSQLAYLRVHGCDLAQGFHFGRPMPAEEFAAAASAWRETSRTAKARSA